jgi:hypothetical protein
MGIWIILLHLFLPVALALIEDYLALIVIKLIANATHFDIFFFRATTNMIAIEIVATFGAFIKETFHLL